jgi:superfamily II DNA or RNA helicase
LLELDLRLHPREPYQLIYCAEGRRPIDEDHLEGPAQIDQVIDLVGNQLGWPIARYVAETPRVERRRLLRRFGAGDELAFLAAMRCLDEGVDVPDARIAYILASSSNPRQFVQRRGRILRRPPNGEKVARIYDYIAVPGAGSEVDFTTERRLMSRELQRAAEFAELADNYADTLEVLRPLKQRFQLMDL